MDHVRCRFERAKDYDLKRAALALDTMKIWYEVEDEARKKGLSAEERFEKRRTITIPSMAAFRQWLDANLPAVLPKSPMAAAIGYALGQWPCFEPLMTVR